MFLNALENSVHNRDILLLKNRNNNKAPKILKKIIWNNLKMMGYKIKSSNK